MIYLLDEPVQGYTLRSMAIAEGDRMFLGMQVFDFSQIESLLPKFRINFTQISTQFCLHFAQI